MNEEELFCKLFPEYAVNGKPLSPYFDLFESGYEQSEKHIAEHKCECERCIHTDCPCVLSDYGKDRNGICDHFKDVFDENLELKARVGLSIDCEKAQKNGELCLGYGGDEDEPCEQCKNCIKCETGYYQLGETEKDDQHTKAKEIIRELLSSCFGYNSTTVNYEVKAKAEQFLKDSEVEK